MGKDFDQPNYILTLGFKFQGFGLRTSGAGYVGDAGTHQDDKMVLGFRSVATFLLVRAPNKIRSPTPEIVNMAPTPREPLPNKNKPALSLLTEKIWGSL